MPAVSIARPSAAIFICVAVSGTCLIMTRIFIGPSLSYRSFGRSRLLVDWKVGRPPRAARQLVGDLGQIGMIVELSRDAKAVARDERPVVDDSRARRVERHAVGAERGRAAPAAQLPRGVRVEADGGHAL